MRIFTLFPANQLETLNLTTQTERHPPPLDLEKKCIVIIYEGTSKNRRQEKRIKIIQKKSTYISLAQEEEGGMGKQQQSIGAKMLQTSSLLSIGTTKATLKLKQSCLVILSIYI